MNSNENQGQYSPSSHAQFKICKIILTGGGVKSCGVTETFQIVSVTEEKL